MYTLRAMAQRKLIATRSKYLYINNAGNHLGITVSNYDNLVFISTVDWTFKTITIQVLSPAHYPRIAIRPLQKWDQYRTNKIQVSQINLRLRKCSLYRVFKQNQTTHQQEVVPF